MDHVKKQGVVVSNSYWIKVVAIFFVGWILMYATRTIFNPIMGVVGEEFGLSNTQLGLANSIFFLTYAVAQIPYVTGYLADSIGSMQVGFYLSGILLLIGLVTFAILAKENEPVTR